MFLRSSPPMALIALILLALSMAPVAESSHAAGPFIQPGMRSTQGGSACTLNFVFDGAGSYAGNVYVGTAAHCVDRVGQSVSTDDISNFGYVAFLGNEEVTRLDYAFIKVKDAYESRVRAAVVGHDAPTGYTRDSHTYSGDLLFFSGYGAGYSTTSLTRESRVGIHVNDNADQYTAEGPILFGDSGGPILHESGRAYGIASRIVVGTGGFYGTWIEGPTVEQMIQDSAARGFTVKLRV